MTGARRTMPVAAAVHSPWQFWDGRADSLWAQALGPIENPAEHGFTRTQVVKALATRYRSAYEQTFAPLPTVDDLRRLPNRASPAGDARAQAAWAAMKADQQATTNTIFANFGKAIAAYERTLEVRPGRFDRYVAGPSSASGKSASLSADETAGLRLFIGKGQCVTCHNGPLLTDQAFHNTGVPPRPGKRADQGRSAGVGKAISDPFNCLGGYSDAPREQCEELSFAVVDSPAQVGAFKVPSLRGVGRRPPYMHAGQFSSLGQVIDHYNRAPKAAAGLSELRPLRLSATERRHIVAFLRTLDETPKPLPLHSHVR
jgi:cytochrome c peroxidase